MNQSESLDSSFDFQQLRKPKERPKRQRKLKTLDPKILSKIINHKPPKKDTFVHYKNPHYGKVNKKPCVRSHCMICPLSTVDYKPRKEKGPRKNVSRRKPIINPKPLCPKCTRDLMARKASAAKRIKQLMEARKRIMRPFY